MSDEPYLEDRPGSVPGQLPSWEQLESCLGNLFSGQESPRHHGTLVDQILSVLLHKRVNNNWNGDFTSHDVASLSCKISAFVQNGIPISFTLVGFHTKIPSIIETYATAPDLGEYSMIRFFRDVHRQVSRIYSPGIHFNFLTEGSTYGIMLDGLAPSGVAQFYTRLESLIARLGARDAIRLFPLAPIQQMPGFEDRHHHHLEQVRIERGSGWRRLSPDAVFSPAGLRQLGSACYLQHLAMMTRTVNVGTHSFVPVRESGDASRLRSQVMNAHRMYVTHWAEVIRIAVRMTDWYLAFNRARQEYESRYFQVLGIDPSIPASLTSKRGKLCFRSNGSGRSVLPHHGAPFWSFSHRCFRPPRVMPLWQWAPIDTSPMSEWASVSTTEHPGEVFFWQLVQRDRH